MRKELFKLQQEMLNVIKIKLYGLKKGKKEGKSTGQIAEREMVRKIISKYCLYIPSWTWMEGSQAWI